MCHPSSGQEQYSIHMAMSLVKFGTYIITIESTSLFLYFPIRIVLIWKMNTLLQINGELNCVD
jgi:hypothetical protein